MKKAILILFAVLFFSRQTYALDGHIGIGYPENMNADYFSIGFSTAPNSTLGGSMIFTGFATDWTVLTQQSNSALAAVILSGTFFQNKGPADISSMTISGSQSNSIAFYAPTSSPTILTYQVQAGATFQIRLGGIKTDR